MMGWDIWKILMFLNELKGLVKGMDGSRIDDVGGWKRGGTTVYYDCNRSLGGAGHVTNVFRPIEMKGSWWWREGGARRGRIRRRGGAMGLNDDTDGGMDELVTKSIGWFFKNHKNPGRILKDPESILWFSSNPSIVKRIVLDQTWERSIGIWRICQESWKNSGRILNGSGMDWNKRRLKWTRWRVQRRTMDGFRG